MSKSIVKLILVLGIGLLIPADAFAAPAYGTKMPESGKLFMGGQTHYVAQRHLEDDNEEIESLAHFLLISYGVNDWVSLDLKGGAGNITHNRFSGSDLRFPSFLSGGYGFRIKLYDQDRKKAVFGFQHISVHPYSIKVDGVKHKAVMDDWQLSFLGSYELDKCMPYFGGKWSRMDYIHWIDNHRNRVKSDLSKSIGVVVGVDIPVKERIWVNVEGQFVDVNAVSASLNFSF